MKEEMNHSTWARNDKIPVTHGMDLDRGRGGGNIPAFVGASRSGAGPGGRGRAGRGRTKTPRGFLCLMSHLVRKVFRGFLVFLRGAAEKRRLLEQKRFKCLILTNMIRFYINVRDIFDIFLSILRAIMRRYLGLGPVTNDTNHFCGHVLPRCL